ncbi:MAG: hypothetical protein WEB88_01405 [Gemmatimonadota bacterium]
MSGIRRTAAITAAVAAAVALALPANAFAQQAITTQQKAAERRANSPFNLNAGPTAVLQGNLVQCGIDNQGNICTDIFNSPTGGGGFWPAGTTNQYMFNSGLQIAAINGTGAGPWASDTVGAYFFDARGTQPHGTPLTNVFNSLNPADLANWPQEAHISNTDIFNPAIVGQKTASAQDSWVQYWDGDPNRISARDHPMGVKVTQRTLAFNAPAGAEHSIFFIIDFENVTNDPDFQVPNEAKFSVQLPDGGWTFTNVYAAFGADPDVTTHAGNNFSTAILPYNLSVAYHSEFETDDFNYAARPSLYAPPFMQAPGLVGVSYLKSPIDPATGREIGLTMFTNTTNGGSFPDMVGVKQLFRYLKGDTQPAAGDNSCNQGNPIQNRVCYLAQEPADTRFYMVSGPFDIEPGQSATIVVGMSHATALRIPGYTIGNTLRPGIPSRFPGAFGNPIRDIERMAGLVSLAVEGTGADAVVDLDASEVVQNSLLFNAEVGRAIFDNQFLLPSAPASPPFTLVPGDRQVTVLWEQTPTEQAGDPFFQVADDPVSPFFNPNFREFDVEGYRIYRAEGLQGDFELLAQFDKAGTTITDFTGQLDPDFVPEEGDYGAAVEYELEGDIIQFPAGSRIRDAVSGAVVVLDADTVHLDNTGVPFVFVDNNVKNGITYRYSVTAFDVNSLESGSSSLESPRTPKNVVPRSSGQVVTDPVTAVAMFGDSELDPDGDYPTIDASGRFSGPQPPTNGFRAGELALALGQALKTGQTEAAVIDSVIPLTYSVEYHVTTGDGSRYVFTTGELNTVRRGANSHVVGEAITALGADTAAVSGIFDRTPRFAGTLAFDVIVAGPQYQSGIADFVGATSGLFWFPTPPPNAGDGGSRWFVGENESAADPTLGVAAGVIPGFTIFTPQPFADANVNALMRRFYQGTFAAARAADFEVTWSGGTISGVRDLTHDLPVHFKARPQASWGFIPDADGNGVINYFDTRRLEFHDGFGGWRVNPPVPLSQNVVVAPVDVTGDGAANGSGFGLYINGSVYFFQGTPPASGTWKYRSYIGSVTQADGAYAFEPTDIRTPAVPGLRLVLDVEAPSAVAVRSDLSQVHTVPDPYYVRSEFDIGPSNKTLRFVNLPQQALIRIFTVNGTLVRTLEHNDVLGGGEIGWDLRNRNNQFVSSGVYFYVVEGAGGETKTGRFTVVQFAR